MSLPVASLLRIAVVLVRYRLDEVVDGAHRLRVLRWARWVVPRASAQIDQLPRGERLVLALTELGPIFVKFGQLLSTRRDLLPDDIADALTALQDKVAPFPRAQARHAVERALCKPVAESLADFDESPLASASIAQVHAASLADGRSVVVKVLRPDIRVRIERDIALLRGIGGLVDRVPPNAD